MHRVKGLTRIEILVVAGVVTFIVLLVLCTRLLMSTADKPGMEQTRCMANLKQWGLVFNLYTDDHDGSFISGESGDNGQGWFETFRPYHEDHKLGLCPAATKPYTERGRSPFGAWKVGEISGSYGLNGWVYNPAQGKTDVRGRGPAGNYWGNLLNVPGSNNVPVLADAMWFEGWPRQADEPPPDENWPGGRIDQEAMKPNQNEMRRFCINRHEGHVNVLFMDWSVRKVGLKELWTLKWHRSYNVNGPRTRAGGAQPMDWPQWMMNLRDY